MPEEQARGIAEAFKGATGEADLATKRDLDLVRAEMREMKVEIMGELKLSRWMLGILLGGVIALILKSFFPG